MPTARETQQSKIDQLLGIIERDVGESVDGHNFALWASQNYFQSVSDPPTSDELEDSLIDGASDLGLDLYFSDEEAATVYLVQSKLRSNARNINRQELDSFLQLPTRLMDRDSFATSQNFPLLEAASEFRDCIENGFEVALVYLSTERATPQIERLVNSFNAQDEHSLHPGHATPCYITIVGVDDLLRSSIVSDAPTDTELTLLNWYEGSDENGANRYLSGMIAASELVRVFKLHRHDIFRLNPRGPLGVVKVNKEIKESLDSEINRKRFFFLNNGLTAVCESFRMVDDRSGLLDVRDFQIVNGCQTTWTLYEHDIRSGSLEDVYLSIKLVEASRSNELANMISQASNSQSPMKDWDFLFNENEQLILQREFENLEEPLFYELKRGEQRFIRGSRGRKTTIKDVAQAMWAFIGYPGEARDRLREIPRYYKTEGSVYHTVFFQGVTARHLWLPYEVHERVKREYKESTPTNVNEAGQVNRRLHIVWLIGKLISKALNLEEYRDIDAGSLSEVSSRIDDWFPQAYVFADVAIDHAIQQNRDATGNLRVNLRQLYRVSQYYPQYLQALDATMRIQGSSDLFAKITGNRD